MAEAITITLPGTLYRQLEQMAALSQQPAEVIVAQSLAHSLPPLLDEIPRRYQADVYPLLRMSDAELQKEARRTFSTKLGAEYEALLNKQRNASLTAKEQLRLETLRREADVLTFRRSYAAVLLKRRGYRLPAIQELELPA